MPTHREDDTFKEDVTRLCDQPPVASAMFDSVTSTLFDDVLTPPIPGNRSNTVKSRWSQRNGSFVSSVPSVAESSGRVSCVVRLGEGGEGGREGGWVTRRGRETQTGR